MIAVLMGVSGCGKTTIGRLVANRAGWVFADADDYFPQSHKQKMAGGTALTDEERAPWLGELNRLLRGWDGEGTSGVLACSALKVKYQETLKVGVVPAHLRFIFLDGPKELIATRLEKRRHEYMNPKLLDSQLATLERPADALHVVNDRAPEEVAGRILEYLAASRAAHGRQIF